MRKLIFTAIALLGFSMSNHAQKTFHEQIVGKWCNPYTYASTGELKGFEFQKGGVCRSVNIPSLDLKTWEIKDGYLIIKGISKNEDGTTEEYLTRERIEQLTSDSLTLITQESNPRLAFLYINTKVIKKLVTPEQKK